MFLRILVVLSFLTLTYNCASPKKRSLAYYRVKVQSGDTLAQIAQRFDTSWRAILAFNENLERPTDLQAGMVIKVVPGPGGYVAEKPTVNRRSKGFFSSLFGGEDEQGEQHKRATAKSGGLLFGGGSSIKNLQWPLRGSLTSKFGKRGWGFHHGIDIDGIRGDPVRAAASGRVTFYGWKRGYGRVVMVDHGTFSTRYAHLSSYAVVKNQKLAVGDVIGEVGRSGNATGSHLHFEVRTQEGAVDPMIYLIPEDNHLLSANP